MNIERSIGANFLDQKRGLYYSFKMSFGPNIIFDKSASQSLSVNEVVV